MKTKRSLLFLSAMLAFTACKEKEVLPADSKYITVTAPIWDLAVADDDDILVKAIIKPEERSVVSYRIWLIDNEKKSIYDKKTECDCAGKDEVQLEANFKYDIKATTKLLLHVDAVLNDGTNIQEEVPFTLVDVKK